MKMSALYCAFAIGVLAVLPARAQTEREEMQLLLKSYHEQAGFDGVLLAADLEGIILHEAIGWRDAETKAVQYPMSTFRIGAIEQAFCALLCLQLAEKGLISLHQTAEDFFGRSFNLDGVEVNIFHLLTHTSGLQDFTTLPNIWNDSLQKNLGSQYILDHYISDSLLFEPGTARQFSHSNYFLLACILEKISEQPLEMLYNAYIFSQIGLLQTGIGATQSDIPYISKGSYRLGNEYFSEPAIQTSNLLGTASMFSNAYDLYIWERSLYGHPYLSADNMKWYLSPVFETSDLQSHGFAWSFTKHKDDTNQAPMEIMTLSGHVRAQQTYLIRVPSRGICIIILSNSGFERGYEMAQQMLKILTGRQPTTVKPNWTDKLYKIYQMDSLSGLLAYIKKEQAKKTASQPLLISDLLQFTERFILTENIADTEKILAFINEAYPSFAFGYYYSGKVALLQSQTAQGESFFKKATLLAKDRQAVGHAQYELEHLQKHRTD